MLSSFTRANLKSVYKNNLTNLTTVRFQSSSKTANLNLLKANVATKVTKKTDSNDYNALSNQNLTAPSQVETKPLVNPSKKEVSKPITLKMKTKQDYTSLPKVPKTNYLDPEYVAIDALYSGFRPLAMTQLKKELVPARNRYAHRGVSCWSVSAAGLETYEEWDDLFLDDYQNLYPFRPPTSEKVSIRESNDRFKDDLVYSSASSLPDVPQPKLKLRRGRMKPSAIRLLHKKRKP